MDKRNDIDVIINGREYTLSGFESDEYLQQIADYINAKYEEFKKRDGYSRLDVDMRNTLFSINVSYDYFKMRNKADELQKRNEELEKEIFDIKHEMITMKSEIEKYKDDIKQIGEEKRKVENDVIRLETELGKVNNQSYNKKRK